MSLVDVVVDHNDLQAGTSPVWHCSKCEKVEAGRSYEMNNAISRNQSLDWMTSNTTLRDNDLARKNELQEATIRIASLEVKLGDLAKELKSEKEARSADLLYELRKRVADFTLN